MGASGYVVASGEAMSVPSDAVTGALAFVQAQCTRASPIAGSHRAGTGCPA
jgi:hypothetical protein